MMPHQQKKKKRKRLEEERTRRNPKETFIKTGRGSKGVTAADRAKVKQSTGGLGGLADLARKEKARRAGIGQKSPAQTMAARLQKGGATPISRPKPTMKKIRLPSRRSSSRSH